MYKLVFPWCFFGLLFCASYRNTINAKTRNFDCLIVLDFCVFLNIIEFTLSSCHIAERYILVDFSKGSKANVTQETRTGKEKTLASKF